jgi:hypothetical protein
MQEVNSALCAPDAAQRVALAKRCAAEPGSSWLDETGVPALRCTAEEALHRVRDTKRRSHHRLHARQRQHQIAEAIAADFEIAVLIE